MRFTSFYLTILIFVTALHGCVQEYPDVARPEVTDNVQISDGLTKLDITKACSFYIGENMPLNVPTDSIEAFITANFSLSTDEKMIRFGVHPEAEVGWAYTRLTNVSAKEVSLAVKGNYRRSDGISGYIITGDSVRYFGEVKRTTLFYERAFPTFDLSLPVKIPGNCTVGLLIRSERFANVHALGLLVYERNYYRKQAIAEEYFEIANGSVLVLIIVAFVVLSIFFRDNLLFALAVFLTNIFLLFLSHNGYFDTFGYPEGIGLSASNSAGFFNILANVTFHPLGYVIVAGSLKKRNYYLIVAGILMLLNLAVAMCYLADPPVYAWLDGSITHIIIILTNINILWVIYHAYLHLRRSGKGWYLIASVVMLLPPAIRYVLEFINVGLFRSYDAFTHFSSYVLIFAFSYIAFLQLQKKLILKSEADRRVLQVSQSLNELNLNEIKKIGRNLHDQVGNTLASALGYLNMNENRKSKAKNLIEIAIWDIRLISHNIVKQDAGEFTTWHIDQLIERMNDFSVINYHFKDYSDDGLRKLNAIEKQNIYNIIQELLTNVLKHSEATDAFVEIFDGEGKLRINVEDNGIGFNTETDYNGIGLQNIRSRVEILAFHYILESTDKGVTALIEVNYEN
jgi:signal transduction histidine kinase